MDKFIFKPNNIYEFTINPDDRHQFANKKDTRVRCVKEAIEEELDRTEEISYHLFPEISMPQYGRQDKNRYARVHYHGIMLFKTAHGLRRFFTHTWHRLTGISSIQFNEYRVEWDEYCRKQKYLFQNCERIKNASWKSIIELSNCIIPTDDEEMTDVSLPQSKVSRTGAETAPSAKILVPKRNLPRINK